MNAHLNLRIESEYASVIEAQKYVIFMGSKIATNLTVVELRRTNGRTLGENPSAT